MRRPSIIAYFPRLGVTVLGGTLVLSAGYSTDALAAPKAPKSAGGAAAPDPTGGGDAAAGPDAKTKKAAREEGMTFLRQCAVGLVLSGVTTLREINKVTFVE